MLDGKWDDMPFRIQMIDAYKEARDAREIQLWLENYAGHLPELPEICYSPFGQWAYGGLVFASLADALTKYRSQEKQHLDLNNLMMLLAFGKLSKIHFFTLDRRKLIRKDNAAAWIEQQEREKLECIDGGLSLWGYKLLGIPLDEKELEAKFGLIPWEYRNLAVFDPNKAPKGRNVSNYSNYRRKRNQRLRDAIQAFSEGRKEDTPRTEPTIDERIWAEI